MHQLSFCSQKKVLLYKVHVVSHSRICRRSNALCVLFFIGCTLCDKVKDVLYSLPQEEFPHSLKQIDITDAEHEEWYEKYKYDIPVLHIDERYWTKHRLDQGEAKKTLKEAMQGIFQTRQGQPDAGAMEHKRKDRNNNSQRNIDQ